MVDKKTIVITGASDGIGAAAARELKKLGHNVIIVGRSKEKTERIANELNCPFHLVDFADLSQVKRLANELNTYDKIDVLANNAGGAQNERRTTTDGFEKTFQINHLGAFLLTNLLLDKLCKCKAIVIQTTSIGANLFGAEFNINDLNNNINYSPTKAYGNAKLSNILFTRELNKRYKDKGISAVAFEPGVVRTNFGAESTKFLNFCYHTPLKYLFTISPKRSAKRLVRLALGIPGKDYILGGTYSNKKQMKVLFRDEKGEIAKKLWDESEKMVEKFLR